MRQGTVSVVFGCHSPIHSMLVTLSWRKIYGGWPRPWELACIFLHDIGHWGKDYLDDPEQKARHWELGARKARWMFGEQGNFMVEWHCVREPERRSLLYYPDKYSWFIAPYWWFYLNKILEPKLKQGMGNREAVLDFKKMVCESIESGEFRSTHGMFMDRCRKAAQRDG